MISILSPLRQIPFRMHVESLWSNILILPVYSYKGKVIPQLLMSLHTNDFRGIPNSMLDLSTLYHNSKRTRRFCRKEGPGTSPLQRLTGDTRNIIEILEDMKAQGGCRRSVSLSIFCSLELSIRFEIRYYHKSSSLLPNCRFTCVKER